VNVAKNIRKGRKENYSMDNIKILISCHKETDYVKNEILQPIQVGAALAKNRLEDMLYDDVGGIFPI
jgi:hypothetical protein